MRLILPSCVGFFSRVLLRQNIQNGCGCDIVLGRYQESGRSGGPTGFPRGPGLDREAFFEGKPPFAGLQLAGTVFSLAVRPFCNSQAARRSQRFMLQAAPMK